MQENEQIVHSPGMELHRTNEGTPGLTISPKKLAANRRNAQLSTGPKTKEGKSRSRRNRVKHGILTSVLLIREGNGTEEHAEFARLLCDLRKDLAPVGALEKMLVEKLAVCQWEERRILQCEGAMEIGRAHV